MHGRFREHAMGLERRRDMLKLRRQAQARRIKMRKDQREAEDMAIRILISAAKVLIAGIIGGLVLYGWLVWKYM